MYLFIIRFLFWNLRHVPLGILQFTDEDVELKISIDLHKLKRALNSNETSNYKTVKVADELKMSHRSEHQDWIEIQVDVTI